jgi:hypothetical protein
VAASLRLAGARVYILSRDEPALRQTAAD